MTTSGVDRLKTIPGLTQTEYDFTGIVTENGASWYYFTVTAVGDGQYADSEESEIDPFNEAGCLRYTNQLEPPTGLRWTGHVANWGFVDFAEGYLVAVYRLDDGGNPSYVAGGIVNGGVNSLDCRNYFAVAAGMSSRLRPCRRSMSPREIPRKTASFPR